MNEVRLASHPLQGKVRQLEAVLDMPSPNEAELLGELDALADRFSAERLQLAVIGQFKRGKSSLVNALIGEEVLPSGVLPVTAIATFLEAGDWRVGLLFDDGHEERQETGSAEETRAIARMYVSEAGNPRNLKHVRQVHVRLHSELLDAGIVLIDTPGVGSTLEHNTQAAEAALPAADVALFVLSPDPPITQVEIDYLTAAREHAARLIIVLNKCDLLSAGEREETLEFITSAIKAKSGLEVEEILCVSARGALLASKSGDEAAAQASGVPALAERLMRFAREDKRQALEEALAKKAARLVASLRLENDIALRTLHMPLEQLATCADLLQRAMDLIDLERRRSRDLLAGDRQRLIDRARTAAEDLGDRVGRAIRSKVDQADALDQPDAFAGALLEEMVEGFARSFPSLRDQVGDDLRVTLEQHAEEAQRIATSIKLAASAALSIDLGVDEARIDADVKLKPAWYDRRIEFLTPIPPGSLDRLLPRAARRRRAAKRVRRDLDAALVRNVEKLRWSLQQAIEESVRSFQSALDVHLDTLRASTAGAVALAVQRRREQSSEHSPEIEARLRARGLLDRLTNSFRPRAGAVQGITT